MQTILTSPENTTSETILTALEQANIFSISPDEQRKGYFMFTELCDGYYEASLTREQLLILADEIRALAGNTFAEQIGIQPGYIDPSAIGKPWPGPDTDIDLSGIGRWP